MNLIEHMKRAIAFSRATYGPGHRTAGVSDHIRKELSEVAADKEAGTPTSYEWTDVAILALDGLWRAVAEEHKGATHDKIAEICVRMIVDKQNKNEKRSWPDWRTADPTKAIEHVRGTHD